MIIKTDFLTFEYYIGEYILSPEKETNLSEKEKEDCILFLQSLKKESKADFLSLCHASSENNIRTEVCPILKKECSNLYHIIIEHHNGIIF